MKLKLLNKGSLVFVICLLLLSNNAFCERIRQDKNWNSIDSVFKNIKKPVVCDFEFHMGVVDLDVFEPMKFLSAEITKLQVIKLIDYYSECCPSSSLIGPKKALNSKMYSIELYYKVKDKRIIYLLVIICSNDYNLLLHMRSEELPKNKN